MDEPPSHRDTVVHSFRLSSPTMPPRFRRFLKMIAWVLLFQLLLVNISASIYAHRLTHYYEGPPSPPASRNIFQKTWQLFTGPRLYRDSLEPLPPFPADTVMLNAGDVRLHAWYSGHDSSSSCVIFFHGLTGNKSNLSPEAAVLRQMGFNVMLVDLRGHGKSGGSTGSFGVDETAEVQKAFEWAKGRGNKKLILYGVSLGAVVCLKAVSDGLVQPAAIIADMPFGSLHQHLRSRAQVMGFPGEPYGALVCFWMGVRRGFNGFGHDVAAYAANVHCPVLLQWGEKDVYVKKEEILQVYESLASPDKKLVTYPDANHQSYLGIDPIKWQKEMKQFLSL